MRLDPGRLVRGVQQRLPATPAKKLRDVLLAGVLRSVGCAILGRDADKVASNLHDAIFAKRKFLCKFPREGGVHGTSNSTAGVRKPLVRTPQYTIPIPSQQKPAIIAFELRLVQT